MKAVILAAGYATRLYPLTENFPKPLLPVGGKPILDWLIDDLKSVIGEFIVVSNHKFASQFSSWADGRNIRIIDDGTSTNDMRLGAVKDIQLATKDINDDVLVMAGDNVLTFSLVPFVEYARQTGTSCVMCHEENRLEALRKTAVITVDPDNLITSYEEKPKLPKAIWQCRRSITTRRRTQQKSRKPLKTAAHTMPPEASRRGCQPKFPFTHGGCPARAMT